MERVVHIAKNHSDAQEWDVKQATEMSHEERQRVAKKLRERVYGEQPDVREWHRKTDQQ